MHVISFDVATKSLAVSITEYNLNYKADIRQLYENYTQNSREIANSADFIAQIRAYNALLRQISDILSNIVKIHYMNVVDLIPGQKVADTTTIQRTERLYDFLTTFENQLGFMRTAEYKILIEYQMGPNDKSRVISSQILYHMMHITKQMPIARALIHKSTGFPVESSGNSNTINVSDTSGVSLHKSDAIVLLGPTLKNKFYISADGQFRNFTTKYQTNYSANKAHSKFNFLKLIELLSKYSTTPNTTPNITAIKKKNIDDIADSVIMAYAYILKEYDFVLT